ncbi:MAG: hypothetical protein AAF799_34240 [Myxococcota bacterium]
MPDLAERMATRALATASRWFGIGVAAMPIVDIADRASLFVLLSSPQSLADEPLLVPFLQIGFFVAVGIGASATMRRHRRHVRPWFFAAAVVPLVAYVLNGGLGLSAGVAALALVFSYLQLRLAHDAPYEGPQRPPP